MDLQHASGRQEGLARELEQTRRRLDTAVARWEAGVDRWAEVIQALDRVLETRLLGAALRREIALSQIRYTEIAGDLDGLVRRLGQEAAE